MKMEQKRFEENILVDEAYTNYGKEDKNADVKKSQGIAKHFAETLEFEDKKKWYDQLPQEPTLDEKALTQEQLEEFKKEASSALHGDTLVYETKSDEELDFLADIEKSKQTRRQKKDKGEDDDDDDVGMGSDDDDDDDDDAAGDFGDDGDEGSDGGLEIPGDEEEPALSGEDDAYVEALNKFAHDSVDANKEKAVSSMSNLLMHHPEREKMLLTNIINKLGDPSQAVASKVVYNLSQLLYNHPNMKSVVLAEIEKMLFRANISSRAQYYGVCFLNQFYLGKDDSKIAESLVRIYFSFFKASIKKGEIDSRLMSAILTGVKRACPFADKERLNAASEHLDAIYKLVHLTSLNVAIHALALLFHITDKENADRYYTALYRKLLDVDIFTTSHCALLFSLIYKSLKRDDNINRVIAFIKRLLQLCAYMQPEHCCGVLFLVSQVLKDGDKKDAVKLHWKADLKQELKPESLEIKDDTNATLDAEDSEDGQTENPKVEPKVEVKEQKVDLLKGDKRDLLLDDDEETYVDLKMDSEGNVRPRKRKAGAALGWFHAKVKSGEEDDTGKLLETKIQLKKSFNMDKEVTEYNPLARNPAFAGAQFSAYYELIPLATHFHPTVKMFAEKLLNEQVIQYSGDPLKDFACIRFLDRFVFKNPKKRSENEEVDGIKKVRGSHPKFAARKNYTAKESDEELDFLADIEKSKQTRRQKKDKGEDDDDDDVGMGSDDDDDDDDDAAGDFGDDGDEGSDGGLEISGDEEEPALSGEDDGSDGGLEISGDEEEPALSGEDDAYVEALNKFAHDSVDANKEKAVSSMSNLLMHHPEREKMLLTNIINKLGDPSQAVASKVVYNLCQLLHNHPNMKSVVLAEIEKMLFRANISSRAQYYGVCFLNQFYLGKDDSKIAESLVRIYFSFFKASIKKGEIDSRLMSAILTGVKRACPFADKERLNAASEHLDAIYKLVHLTSLNVAIHALALLFHITDKENADRYYTALYRKLLDVDIFTTSHCALLFSLIYKSLKRDDNINRVIAFIKRLLQLCAYMQPEHCCGVLFLVSQVLKDGDKKDAVKLHWKADLKQELKPESLEIKDDTNATLDAEDSEDGQTENPKVEPKVEVKEQKVDLLKGDKRDLLLDDDEETYVDLKMDSEGNVRPRKRKAGAALGWFHAKVKSGEEDDTGKLLETKIQLKKSFNMDKEVTEYNPLARNPAFAGAQFSAYYELIPLATHFHPTVKMFAEKLLNEQVIQYSGDPLKDFACIRFLDRFVFKNPKKRSENEEVDGIKKVRGSHPKFAARKNYTAKGLKCIPVNSSTYLNEDIKKIPVDERFLYDFFQKRREAIEKGSDDDDSDADSVTSEDFDQYLDKVTGSRNEESDEELDFLADIEKSKQTRRQKKDKGEDDDDDDVGMGSDDDDDDDDDAAGDFGDDGDEGSDGGLEISGDEEEPALSGEDDGLKCIPVNSSTYLNEDIKKIPVDERFLYDFFQKRREAIEKGSDDDDSDADSVTSEDFDQYLDKVTGSRNEESDEELDFLADIEKSKQTRRQKKDKGEDDDDDDVGMGSDDDDDDDDDAAGDFGDDGDEGSDGGLEISGDEEEPALSGEDDGKDDLGSLFASAEQFSTLLEDTATSKRQGSSQAVSNADNSSQKQLAWEENRDTWIKGYIRKILGNNKGKGKFQKRKGGKFDGAGGKRKKVK